MPAKTQELGKCQRSRFSLVTYYQEPPSLAASNGPLSFFYKPSPLAEGGVKGKWSAKAILRVSLTGEGPRLGLRVCSSRGSAGCPSTLQHTRPGGRGSSQVSGQPCVVAEGFSVMSLLPLAHASPRRAAQSGNSLHSQGRGGPASLKGGSGSKSQRMSDGAFRAPPGPA